MDPIQKIEKNLFSFSSAYSGLKTGLWTEEGFKDQCIIAMRDIENLLKLVKAYEKNLLKEYIKMKRKEIFNPTNRGE